jgi:uncharacterized protein (DUF983 family)
VTSEETPAEQESRRGRPALWAVAFVVLVAGGVVLALSALSRSLSAGASWLAVALSAVAIVLALVSLRRR